MTIFQNNQGRLNSYSSGVLWPWVLRVGANLVPTTKTYLQDYFV